jgi:hypothetical protein
MVFVTRVAFSDDDSRVLAVGADANAFVLDLREAPGGGCGGGRAAVGALGGAGPRAKLLACRADRACAEPSAMWLCQQPSSINVETAKARVLHRVLGARKLGTA